MAADLRFDCDLNATRKHLEQTGSAKWENQPIAWLQFHAARSLTWFHVESTTRVSRRAPFQVKEFAIGNLVFSCQWEHSREVRLMTV
jgi:hypothetical protein